MCNYSSHCYLASSIPTVKVLAFNFYAVANAASERSKFERNNELLDQILLVAAQFGDVPVLIAGDFQMEPGMYPAVQLALDHWGWADPLLQTNEVGEVFRPNTFFQQAATVDGEGQSSIGGILMNRTALAALVRIEVLDHRDRQHRPVQATFAWDRIQQAGTILQKFAKLDVSNVPKCDTSDPVCPYNQSCEQLWLQYETSFQAESASDSKWGLFNDFALDVLLQHGKKALVPEAAFPNFARHRLLHHKSSLGILLHLDSFCFGHPFARYGN